MALTTVERCSIVTGYLEAVAGQDWDHLLGCLSPDVQRHGPYGDDYRGIDDYMAFLREIMPSLPGYRMDIDKVTGLDDGRVMAELRETVDVQGAPLVTPESLVFEVDAGGRVADICIYIRQSPPA